MTQGSSFCRESSLARFSATRETWPAAEYPNSGEMLRLHSLLSAGHCFPLLCKEKVPGISKCPSHLQSQAEEDPSRKAPMLFTANRTDLEGPTGRLRIKEFLLFVYMFIGQQLGKEWGGGKAAGRPASALDLQALALVQGFHRTKTSEPRLTLRKGEGKCPGGMWGWEEGRKRGGVPLTK